MLKRVISIHNVTKFREYNAHGDISFDQTTLIYAGNGRGKSTLAAILRSLSQQEPELVLARRTAGSQNPPFINLRTDSANIKFENETWTDQIPDLVVFDSDFVNSHIFSGDHVTSDHRKALYHLVIGEHGVDLARRIDEIDERTRSLSTQIDSLEQEIRAHISSGLELAEYVSLSPSETIDQDIENQLRLVNALRKSNEIEERANFSKLSVPPFPNGRILELLLTDLDVISTEAEAAVKAHISKLSGEGTEWIEHGRKIVEKGDLKDCPFCGQPLDDSHLIEHYKNFFNRRYEEFKNELVNVKRSIQEQFGQDLIDTNVKALAENRTHHEFWKQHLEYEFPQIHNTDLAASINMLGSQAHDLLRQKQGSLLDPLEPPGSYSDSVDQYSSFITQIQDVNLQIDQVNEQISDLKEQVDPEKLAEAEAELEVLRDSKYRFEGEAEEACSSYIERTEELDELREEKEQLREELDEYTAEILGEYETNINRFLEISTDIRIANVQSTHLGGRPRAGYELQINGVTVPIGSDRVTDEPSFTTTLSDGDRNSLAFAFFLALLDAEQHLEDKVIVIDDPITSLDHSRRTCTYQEVARLAQDCRQLIVMSHDPHFLADIASQLHSTKHLQIKLAGNGSEIRPLNLNEKVKNVLIKQFQILQAYASHREGDPDDVVTKIRPYLEGYLRIGYPDQFPPADTLGACVKTIRSADPQGPIGHLKGEICDELSAINDYSRKFHHDLNANASEEEVDPDELERYIVRMLELRKKL